MTNFREFLEKTQYLMNTLYQFGEDTDWQEAYARRKEGYDPAKVGISLNRCVTLTYGPPEGGRVGAGHRDASLLKIPPLYYMYHEIIIK